MSGHGTEGQHLAEYRGSLRQGQRRIRHERALLGRSDLLGTLREEILAVIARHVNVDPDKVKVEANRNDTVSTLKVDIEIPAEGMTMAA